MTRLQRHATDLPGRWKEPRALAATDHTAERAHQGRGWRSIRRRVSGECDRRRRRVGSLIPHACAIRALMIAMIEAAFRTPAVAGSRRADRAPTRGDATARRAVRVAAITGNTDRKDPVTETAGLQAKRCVHSVGAAAVRSDWTYSPNRGTTDRTASARRSPRRSRGSGDQSGPSPSASSAYAIGRPRDPRRGCGRCRACGRTERAHKSLGKPHRT